MPSDVLVLHHGQDQIFVGPRSTERQPWREEAFARRIFREALTQSNDGAAVRRASEAWGLAGIGAGLPLDRDLCERIFRRIDEGQLEIRRLPIFPVDDKAEEVIRSLLSGELPADFRAVGLPRRLLACFDQAAKYLPPNEQRLFREDFGDDGRTRLIAVALERFSRLSSLSFARGARTLQPPLGVFGDFAEQLDVIDWLAIRLNQAQSASELDATARELAALIQQVGVAFFVRAMKSLRVWRPMPAGAAETAPPPASVAVAPRASSSGPAPAPEQEFANPSTQAATLKEAAKNGTPFCEICEKMRKAG